MPSYAVVSSLLGILDVMMKTVRTITLRIFVVLTCSVW